MDQLPHGPAGWAWWLFGAVILNIVVNVVASYAKPYVDIWLDNLSTSRKFRSQKAKEKFDKDVEELLSDPMEANWMGTRIVIDTLIMAMSYLSCFPLVFDLITQDTVRPRTAIFIFATAIFLMVLGLIARSRMNSHLDIMDEYRRRKREQREQEKQTKASATSAEIADSP